MGCFNVNMVAPPRQFDPNILEMMDRPDADPGMVRDDLKYLHTINKLFGGLSAVRRNILPLMNSDGGLISVVNVDKNRANVAMVTTPELAQLAKTDLQNFLNKSFFTNVRAGKRLDNLQPLGDIAAASPISLMVSRSSHRSAFLIGDAHRTVEPFTGEGVFLALEDGLSAALRLLNVRYSAVRVRSHPVHDRLWVNRIYSHVLRYRWLADQLVAFGERIPILTPLAARPILSRRVVS